MRNVFTKFFCRLGKTHAAVVLASFASFNGASAKECDIRSMRVAIDVGHTSVSYGATSARGRSEFSFNLRLSRIIEQYLRSRGLNNVFLKEKEGHENLLSRVTALNALNPDVVISIHHDSVVQNYQSVWHHDGRSDRYSDMFKGWSLLVSSLNQSPIESRELATRIARRLLTRGLPFSTHHAEPIRGENRPFIDRSLGIYRYDNLAVLKSADAPTVLLEAGIILNRDEEEALSGAERQSDIAQAVADGVVDFCSTKRN